MKKLFRYRLFSRLIEFKGGWTRLSADTSMDEGLGLENGEVTVNFDEDQPTDLVKLDPPVDVAPTRKEGVPVFLGFKLERLEYLKDFMEEVKKWGALDQPELSQLVALTYPENLKELNVRVIFITGSSDPLSANLAQVLKELYYPKCEIIDVLKKYYGADIRDIVKWADYERASPRSKEMIDTYLRGYSRSEKGDRAKKFDGYIKKSSGLQSGARGLLQAGHTIDSYIESAIMKQENYWKENYLMNPAIPDSQKIKYLPSYLVVDDTIIEGSTIRGIFKLFLDFFKTNPSIKKRIFGYCLFSYKYKE